MKIVDLTALPEQEREARHVWRRLAANLIDGFLSNLIQCVGFAPVIAVAVNIDVDNDPTAPIYMLLSIVWVLVFCAAGIGFFLVRDGYRSPGKRLMGLEVIDVTTLARCTRTQSLWRNGVLMMLGGIEIAVPLFRSDGRRLGDLVAGTKVVAMASMRAPRVEQGQRVG